MCSSVLLPEPDGPMIATISPASTSRSTPSSARTCGAALAVVHVQVVRLDRRSVHAATLAPALGRLIRTSHSTCPGNYGPDLRHRADAHGRAAKHDAAMADQDLNRTMGLTMATALVIGNMIGSGVFLLPASLAAYGPISHRRLAASRPSARCCWPSSSPSSGRTYPRDRRAVRLQPAGLRRLHRVPDRVGLLDRRLGRQRRDRDRVRRLPGRLLGRPAHNNLLAALSRSPRSGCSRS